MKQNNGMKTYPVAQSRIFNYWLYGTLGLITVTLISLGSITLFYMLAMKKNKGALARCYIQQQEIAQTKQTLAQLQQQLSNHNQSPNDYGSLPSILSNLGHITNALDDETRLGTFEITNNQLQIVGQSNSINNALAFYTKLSESEQFKQMHLVSLRPNNELIEFIINGQISY